MMAWPHRCWALRLVLRHGASQGRRVWRPHVTSDAEPGPLCWGSLVLVRKGTCKCRQWGGQAGCSWESGGGLSRLAV